jgi:diaminopimelate decarboxylase
VNHFNIKGKQLMAEGVSLESIASKVGTPTYVYSSATIERHATVLKKAFAHRDTIICYSVKANSNLAILNVLNTAGLGFDIVSAGELARVQKINGQMSQTVFSGVGKRRDEMELALKAGILFFNVESAEELELLNQVGISMGKPAPFALRVNPDVDAKTHKYISTGLKTSKFGVPFDEALALYKKSKKMKGLKAIGVDCHIGSQLTKIAPLKLAVKKVAGLFEELRKQKFPLTHLDVGGGLGVRYTTENPPTLDEYARGINESIGQLECTLVLEPGRVIVANAGILLTRVLFNKKTKTKHFVIVDAGMNDLMRPALYEAFHEIEPVRARAGKKVKCEIVGPVCESTDVLGKERMISPLKNGDLLAIRSAGAYGMSMASRYNSRALAAEVLVDRKTFRVVRMRETVDALFVEETA